MTNTLDIDGLKSRYDLSQYMGGKVRSNADPISIQCPFHNDNTPSCSIWPDHYYCFGCHATGDIFTYVMNTEGMTFKEAYEFLDGGYTVAFSRKYTAKKEAPPKPLDEELVRRSAQRFDEALPFYHERGIEETLGRKKWLGKTSYQWHYKHPSAGPIVIRHQRYVIPGIFNDKLSAIAFRRDDTSAMEGLANSGHMMEIIDDMERIWGTGNVPQKRLLDAISGAKYLNASGSRWNFFNLDAMVKIQDGEAVFRPVSTLLLHAEPQQLDTLAVASLGFTCIGVPQKIEVLAKLPDLIRDVPMVYIIGQNDREGVLKAQNVAKATNGKGVVIFPPTPVQIHGEDVEIKDDGDLAKLGRLEHWLTRDVGLNPEKDDWFTT